MQAHSDRYHWPMNVSKADFT